MFNLSPYEIFYFKVSKAIYFILHNYVKIEGVINIRRMIYVAFYV